MARRRGVTVACVGFSAASSGIAGGSRGEIQVSALHSSQEPAGVAPCAIQVCTRGAVDGAAKDVDTAMEVY